MNTKVNALAFVLTFISAITFADAPKSVAIVPSTTTAQVYNVHYKSAVAGRVKVSIINNNDQVVYTEVLNNIASFVRPYNFSQLEEGQYTVVVEDKNGKQVEKVDYKLDKIVSFVKVTGVVDMPGKYILNVATNGNDEVSVRIYSGETLLHTEQVTVKNEFAVVYNLNQVMSSDKAITFEINTASGKKEVVTF
jgi:hypothetical protein